MKKLKVYIAGPLFTSGAIDHNIRDALGVAERVKEAGAVPFVPHLYFFWDLMQPHSREFWLELDKMWVQECSILFRLRGRSEGADLEEGWAKEKNIPIFTELRLLFDYIKGYNKMTGIK